MSLDETERYRPDWNPKEAFELSGAAAITRREKGKLIRYWKPFVLYASRPYEVALRTLAADIIAVAEIVESWSSESIIGTGQRVLIRQTPRT